MSRRWRYPRSRRGAYFPVVPQSVSAPGYRDQAGPRPRFSINTRRGRFLALPTVDVTPPAYRTRDRFTARTRRGAFFTIISAQVVVAPPRPPDWIGHDRQRIGTARHGRFLSVPPAPVTATAPAFVPPILARHQRGTIFARRGHFLAFQLTQASAPQPPTWIPPIVSACRPKPAVSRRGRFAACPIGPERPSPFLRRRPTVSPPVRRCHRFDPPWTATPAAAPPRPPDRIGTHRRTCLPPRRGRFVQPSWPQAVPPTPPAIAPTVLRTRRRLVRPPRRRCWQWPVFQATQPVAVDLPDLTATETVTGRITATEVFTGRVTTAEAVMGRLGTAEAVTGRRSATEDVLGRIDTSE